MNLFRKIELNEGCKINKLGIRQVNICNNMRAGTVRGIHLQNNESAEAKQVYCLRGSVWDVCVDLRKQSPTFGQWHAVTLTPSGVQGLQIPAGCGHGYQTLKGKSQLLYLHSGDWVSGHDTGVRYDDPTLLIDWPLRVDCISERDLALPFLSDLDSCIPAGIVEAT